MKVLKPFFVWGCHCSRRPWRPLMPSLHIEQILSASTSAAISAAADRHTASFSVCPRRVWSPASGAAWQPAPLALPDAQPADAVDGLVLLVWPGAASAAAGPGGSSSPASRLQHKLTAACVRAHAHMRACKAEPERTWGAIHVKQLLLAAGGVSVACLWQPSSRFTHSVQAHACLCAHKRARGCRAGAERTWRGRPCPAAAARGRRSTASPSHPSGRGRPPQRAAS